LLKLWQVDERTDTCKKEIAKIWYKDKVRGKDQLALLPRSQAGTATEVASKKKKSKPARKEGPHQGP